MLTLLSIALDRTDERRPLLDMSFEVRHNVGALPTSLTCSMVARVDTTANSVSAQLTLDGLQAETFDLARVKMAEWCERTASALRHVERQPGEVPVYERRAFILEAQPAWVQREYAVLAERYQKCALDDGVEGRSDILSDLIAQRHPLVHIYGAIEQLERLSFSVSDEIGKP